MYAYLGRKKYFLTKFISRLQTEIEKYYALKITLTRSAKFVVVYFFFFFQFVMINNNV